MQRCSNLEVRLANLFLLILFTVNIKACHQIFDLSLFNLISVLRQAL